MPLTPLTDSLFDWSQIRLIATDMDGTLTQNEQFTARLIEALTALAASNYIVIIVTGRSAGWVSAVEHYLPITGAIAENGGVYLKTGKTPIVMGEIESFERHRKRLSSVFEHLRLNHPNLRAANDNPFRLTDWTFDVAGLSAAILAQLAQECDLYGWDFTYSNVQCHVRPKGQSKANALQTVLKDYFPKLTPEQVLVCGDSPNDVDLFEHFPISVGVANIVAYQAEMPYLPNYLTPKAEVDGFLEIAEFLLSR
ncbi:MAG: HAD family hydrolase [Cyanobacteria bacterium P01_H01_bin.15]